MVKLIETDVEPETFTLADIMQEQISRRGYRPIDPQVFEQPEAILNPIEILPFVEEYQLMPYKKDRVGSYKGHTISVGSVSVRRDRFDRSSWNIGLSAGFEYGERGRVFYLTKAGELMVFSSVMVKPAPEIQFPNEITAFKAAVEYLNRFTFTYGPTDAPLENKHESLWQQRPTPRM